jgi:hypothetical protein
LVVAAVVASGIGVGVVSVVAVGTGRLPKGTVKICCACAIAVVSTPIESVAAMHSWNFDKTFFSFAFFVVCN